MVAWPVTSALFRRCRMTNCFRRFYGPGYWSNYMHDTRTLYERQPLADQIFRRQAQFFDSLMGHRTDARILDVGAGDGTMLRLTQRPRLHASRGHRS